MSFNDFDFNQHIAAAISNCGFTSPTPIQQQSIAHILERRDLLGLAQTGTGKTAAFVLPTVQHLLKARGKQVRALVIAPTRELAEQINDFTKTIIANTRLRSLAIYGGVSKNAQVNRLRGGIDIVVACPGRLLDILNDGAIDLSKVETLVLDEADHMFDKGFLPDIRRILKQLPHKRQSLVFSATMPKEIRHLAEDILQDPVRVQINHTKPVKSISHRLYSVVQADKTRLLMHLLKEDADSTRLVFTRTKYKAKNLANKLANSGFRAVSLQGNMSQNKRQQALEGFKDGTYSILVATDIAARGIDVTGISQVINYDVPDTAEAYIHRTGRTGRAACTGKACTFATGDDTKIIRVIERTLDKKLERENISLPQAGRPEATRNNNPVGKGKGTTTAGKNNARRGKRRAQKGNGTDTIFGLRATRNP